MESKLNDDQLKSNPFELSGRSEVTTAFTLLLRAMGYLTLAGYTVWALSLVTKNIANITNLETDALTNLGAYISGGEIVNGGLWRIIFPIVICIWFACIFIRIRRCCIWVVIWRWRWVWKKIGEITLWGRVHKIFGLFLVLGQFVYCICFTIITIIIVWINIKVLIPFIF